VRRTKKVSDEKTRLLMFSAEKTAKVVAIFVVLQQI
jgi:hypothetical protein